VNWSASATLAGSERFKTHPEIGIHCGHEARMAIIDPGVTSYLASSLATGMPYSTGRISIGRLA
jgi:hypothetical protein